MAEENAAAGSAPGSSGGSGVKPIIFYVLFIVNIAALVGAGFMFYQNRKKEAAEPKLEHVIKGEAAAQEKEAHEEKEYIGKVLPLETFVVNLAGSKGRRIVKVNMEIEISGEKVQEEIEKRKAQIRDIIIFLLSSKTYEDISTREGKDQLREEIKDNVNAFLTKGKIVNVYFTELLYQ